MKGNLNKQYKIEDVMGAYQEAVLRFKNDAQRVPERDGSPEAIEAYAEQLHREKYKDVLHPSIIDQFRTEKEQKRRKKAKEEFDADLMRNIAAKRKAERNGN